MIVDGEWGRAMKKRNSILVFARYGMRTFFCQKYRMPQALLSRKMGILPSEPRRLQEPKAVLKLSAETIEPVASAAEPQPSDANGESVQKPNDSSGSPVDPAPEVETPAFR